MTADDIERNTLWVMFACLLAFAAIGWLLDRGRK